VKLENIIIFSTATKKIIRIYLPNYIVLSGMKKEKKKEKKTKYSLPSSFDDLIPPLSDLCIYDAKIRLKCKNFKNNKSMDFFSPHISHSLYPPSCEDVLKETKNQ
jgi:hypothetical protein